MAEATFRVPTAFCEHCRASIEQAVANLAGVEHVAVDLAGQTVAVRFDAAQLDVETIRQRIEGAGFPVPELPTDRDPRPAPGS